MFVGKNTTFRNSRFPSYGRGISKDNFTKNNNFKLNLMSEKTFQTSNRQFGEVLNAELQHHCIPVNEFINKCHFKHDYFYNIRRA